MTHTNYGTYIDTARNAETKRFLDHMIENPQLELQFRQWFCTALYCIACLSVPVLTGYGAVKIGTSCNQSKSNCRAGDYVVVGILSAITLAYITFIGLCCLGLYCMSSPSKSSAGNQV